jgi:hypothetical protein
MDGIAPKTVEWATLLLCALLCADASTAASARIGEATTLLTPGAALRCVQADRSSAECDYRLTNPSEVRELSAHLGELALPVTDFLDFPQAGATAAVLFLVDTSDPNRSAAVRAGLQHIRQMLDAGGPHHTFGIATFDSDLRVVAELGSSRSQLDAALASIRARGRTTEMYRNTQASVELLGDHNAERKKLVLLSDGLAEDRAYFHEDVVAAALEAGVSIDGLGYPRSASLAVALQTLRRLADETGGTFVEGNRSYALTGEYLAAPFASLDHGGSFLVDLTPAIDAGATGAAAIELTLAAVDQIIAVDMPVVLPQPVPAPVVVTAPAPEPVRRPGPIEPVPALAPAPTVNAASMPTSTSDAVSVAATGTPAPEPLADSNTSEQLADAQVSGDDASMRSDVGHSDFGARASTNDATNATPVAARRAPIAAAVTGSQTVYIGPVQFKSEQNMQMWLWIALATLTLLMVALVWTLAGLMRRRRRDRPDRDAVLPAAKMARSSDAPLQTFAYLEAANGGCDRHPITSAAFRIGRHESNELPLDDASISRHHAQIHCKRDGSFSIADLDSMNGVFVNDKRVSASPLKEGDLVELGDVSLRFTMLNNDPMADDETVVMRTIASDDLGTAA